MKNLNIEVSDKLFEQLQFLADGQGFGVDDYTRECLYENVERDLKTYDINELVSMLVED